MERKANIFQGYSEFHNEHYFKWEKKQSQKYFEYRKKWVENADKLIVEKYPLHLDIGISNICNLECTFCARTVRIQKNEWRKAMNMDFNLFKKIIDEAVELGTYSINMNLICEPLIHPQVLEMIRYAKKAGIIDVHFHTHGGLINEEKANLLLKSGLDRLFVSIDSPYKDKYNKIRVLSDFDKVIANLKRLKDLRDKNEQLNPLIRVSMIQFPDIEKQEIEDAKKFFLQFADVLGLQQYVDPHKEIGKGVDYPTGYRSEFVCQQPFTRLSIIEDGRVSPCCNDYDQELIIGDVSKQSLKEIWESTQLEQFRDLMKKGEFYKNSACANCEMAVNADQGKQTPVQKLEPTI